MNKISNASEMLCKKNTTPLIKDNVAAELNGEKNAQKIGNNIINNQAKNLKMTSTTPGTKKNSRKSSIDRAIGKLSNKGNNYCQAFSKIILSKVANPVNIQSMLVKPGDPARSSACGVVSLNYVSKESNLSNNNTSSTFSENKFMVNMKHKNTTEKVKEKDELLSTKLPLKAAVCTEKNSNVNSLSTSHNFSTNAKVFKAMIAASNVNSNSNSNINTNECIKPKLVSNCGNSSIVTKKIMNYPCTGTSTSTSLPSKQNSETNSKSGLVERKKIQGWMMNKKHQTSTNSPVHFPFSNQAGIAKTKESKQTMSMKMNIVNPNFKYYENFHPSTSELLKETLLKNNQSKQANINLGSIISDQGLPPNPVPLSTNQENNYDNTSFELENSTSSIKSTMRENNHYQKEADKISSYITNFYLKHSDYPASNVHFYKFGRLIGRGAFGKVNLGLHVLSGRLVAIKSFNKSNLSNENSKRKILQEVNLMKNLRHQSIVKIYEAIETKKYILIVLEYVCGGDLLSFVRKRTKLNEVTCKFIFRQLMEALIVIHSQNIVHRDIKLDNILIDLNNNIKICDFGVGRQIRKGELMNDQCGTPAYIAPEILKNQGYEGFSVDVWSAGVVLYAMLSGTVPFKATNMTDLHKLILRGTLNPIKDISSEASDLLTGILEIDPKKRLTVGEILNHPWIGNEDELSSNGKIKSKMNLFTNAERILLSKSNIDYRTANKDDLIENFTFKNLDTFQDCENQNVNSKSNILAPFNSSIKCEECILANGLKIENEVLKYYGKVKELNRNYELNNNGEIDNGILINPNQNSLNNATDSQPDGIDGKNNKSKMLSRKISKPMSPLDEEERISEIPTPSEDSHRNSRKNMKDTLSMTNANTFVLDETAVKEIEKIGYRKEYLLRCLYNNELNHATTTYYLLINSAIE